MMKIYVILTMVLNLLISFYILQETNFFIFLYGCTRCLWSLLTVYEILILNIHPTEKNKKFYSLYWVRIFLLYREYIEYSKIKVFIAEIAEGKNISYSSIFTFEKVPHSFYDTIIDGITDCISKLFKK